jgi:hypothetical protein
MDELKEKSTQIGLHSISNLLGNFHQQSLFSEHDKDFSEKYGINLDGKIDRFGVDLTDMQSRIMEGILRGFSETSYKGNMSARDTQEIANEKYNGSIPDSYKYLSEIPRLRVTQSSILEWSGLKGGGISSWARALKALGDLGTTQFCFYYDRLAYDANGVPIKTQKNMWKKEEVHAVDTLFTIKEIRTDKRIDYYEITPSAIFLDQRESYFMMIPYGWREEVKRIFGNKKISSYTFRFLLFLRYQYEIKRRSKKHQKPYSIRWAPKEIAAAIKMPESIYNRKQKRMNDILEDAYSVAQRLGYLTSYKRDGYLDTLFLDDSKYFGNSELSFQNDPKQITTKTTAIQVSANTILDHFESSRKKLDAKYTPPNSKIRENYLSEFEKLLEERTENEIIELITWSTKDPYWLSRLSTPAQIRKNFSEACSICALIQSKDPKTRHQTNKNLAECMLKKISSKPDLVKIEPLNKFIEFTLDGSSSNDILNYDDSNFQESLRSLFKRYRVEIED